MSYTKPVKLSEFLFYNSGTYPNSNQYTNFASLWAAANTTEGQVDISIENTDFSAANIFSDVYMCSSRIGLSSRNILYKLYSNGTNDFTFREPSYVKNLEIQIMSGATNSMFTVDSGASVTFEHVYMLLEAGAGGSSSSSGSGGGGPTAPYTINLNNGVLIFDKRSTIECRIFTEINSYNKIYVKDQSYISNAVFVGDSSAQIDVYVSGNSIVGKTHPDFAGTLNFFDLVSTDLVYLRTAVDPVYPDAFSGATIESGYSDPGAARENGSIYLRRDAADSVGVGGVEDSIYFRNAGVWNSLAGVLNKSNAVIYSDVTLADRTNISSNRVDQSPTDISFKIGNNNFSSMSTGGTSNGIRYASYSSILGGDQNTVEGSYASIVGGKLNKMDSSDGVYVCDGSVIIGGESNTIRGLYNNAAGLTNAIQYGSYCSIEGRNNSITGDPSSYVNYSSVDGYNNTITKSNESVISGGSSNAINYGTDNTICGGSINTIDYLNSYGTTYNSNNCCISGGISNTITYANRASISGGNLCSIKGGNCNSISSGDTNIITILGVDETKPSNQSFMGGGSGNTITYCDDSAIIGGSANELDNSNSSVILGGYRNRSYNNDYCVVHGQDSATVAIGQYSHSTERFSQPGDCQYGRVIMKGSGASGSSFIITPTNDFILTPDRVYLFDAKITVVSESTTLRTSFVYYGFQVYTANDGNITIDGGPITVADKTIPTPSNPSTDWTAEITKNESELIFTVTSAGTPSARRAIATVSWQEIGMV